MDTLGRDDELRAIHAFLDRPPGGTAGLVLEGEAGIGKSTIWLAGVEAARERGLRVLSSRPARSRVGVAYAALGDLLEDALPDVLPELPAPRRRALETALLLEDGPDEPVDVRTLAVAVRNALQLLAERRSILVAVDDVQWLDPSSVSVLAFAVRRLPDQDVRVLLARRLGTAACVGARACGRRPQAGARARRPAQPGRAASDPARPARPRRSRGRRCCASTRRRAATRSSRSSSHAASGTTSTRPSRCPCRRRWRRSSARGSTGCRTRRAWRCCSPAHTAG